MNTIVFVLLFVSSALSQYCLAPNATGFILEASYTCAKGFYCPNTNASVPWSLPQLCPPTIDCQIKRLGGRFCEPQGLYEPTPCPAGSYCPTFLEKYDCPEGYYCPIGTYEPHECSPMTACAKGSKSSFFYGAIVIVVIVDAFLIGSFFGYRAYLKNKNSKVKTGEMENISDFANQIRPMKMDFKFDRMRYVLKDGRVILDNVTGSIRSGRVTAIMGPSGSGKTTFLSVLMGKVARTSGSLFINGKETEMYKYKKVIGFVPQDDIMLRELTVRENIAFSARVRLPNWDNARIEKLVDVVISSLNLTHVEHIPIGDESKRGVSGGQRKRVNIGVELAAGPSVVFLDEPTSGLDSTQALQVANIMKQLADIGMTVGAVIHQPRYEIFKSFDDIILLCPGGKVAFIGALSEVEKYFTSLGYKFDPRENPADVLMDIVSGNKMTENGDKVELDKAWSERASDFATSSSTSVEQFEVVTEEPISISSNSHIPISERGAPLWKQVWLNHNRYMLQQYRTWTSFVLEIGVASLAGLLMGVSLMSSAGELFAGILVAPYTLISPSPTEWVVPLSGLLNGIAVGLSGAPAGVKTFGEERVLYWREAAAGHSKLAYYIGKSICTFYRFSVTSLHFSMFFYVLSRPLITFGRFYFLIFLMFYCVYGLSSLISMVVRRENSSLLAVVICLFAAVFNGFGPSLVDAREWGISFIWEISYNRWATEAVFSQEVEMIRHVYQIDEISVKRSGYGLERYGMDVGMMIVIGFVYRVIGFLLMIFLNRRKTK